MKKKLIAFGIAFLVLLAGINIVKIIYKDNQAQSAFALGAILEGEYKVGDGEWRPITEGEHISAGEGEVVLREPCRRHFRMVRLQALWVRMHR